MTYRALTIDQLEVSPFNARTDKRPLAPASIEVMAKSLLTNGQIMPIVVHPMKGRKGKFGVFAGQRRYRGFKLLIEQGKLPADHPIDAMIRDAESEAQLIAISTEENLRRWDLYLYETYASLARQRRRGLAIEEIARILGQDVDWVRRGVRLGMLPEPIFKAYAEDQISLECAKAFAATEDEKLQLMAFDAFLQLPAPARTASAVRAILKVGDRELTRLLLFVGEKPYRDAGGRFELDLFAEEDEYRGRVCDEGLLRELADAKLEELRKRIRVRAGRDLRFAAAPPRNDFTMVDRSLEIVPPEGALDPADQARLSELIAQQEELQARALAFVDSFGEVRPGMEGEIAALDAIFDPNEAEIAAIEERRTIPLPEGDIFATIEIDDRGQAEVNYWWASRRAQLAATKTAPRKPVPTPAAPVGASAHHVTPSELKPVADGAAIHRPGTCSADYTARDRADRKAKDAWGLTQEGVQILRSLRRELLRAQLLEDADEGGTAALDYLIWGQLRMLLTQADGTAIGMRRFVGADREDAAGRELIEQTTAGRFGDALKLLRGWSCFTTPDLREAFLAYRALPPMDKGEAAAILACLVLERSLQAEGYRVPLHDLVAAETNIAGSAELREFGAFTPTAPFFNLFSKDHRLELIQPYVSRAALAVAAKGRAADQNAFAERVFTGTSPELLEGAAEVATDWVHPLLAFALPQAQRAPAEEARALEGVPAE